MALNGLATGKNLKPFLCLVRNAYHDLFGTNIPIHDDGKVRLTKANHVNRLRQAFPYYDPISLDNIFDQFKRHLDSHGAEECKRLFEYYFSGVFREQGEFISSSRLYHFLDRRYLLSTLKKGFLYPSIVEYEEYQCLFKLFKGSAFIEKEGVLEDKPFLAEWRGSNQSLLALRNKGVSKTEIDQYLQDSAFVPAYTCFTELHKSHLALHAAHYGSYGLSFKKDEIIMKKKINNTVDNRQFIRPIHYCDNAKSSTPWILLDRIRKHRQDRAERMGLFTDLLLIKPIHETLFHPEYLHSVMHEREWRYVSSEQCFTFEVPHVNSVVVPQTDYQQWLNTKSDPVMDELIQFCDAQNLSIEYI